MFLSIFGHSISIAEKEGDNTPDMRGDIAASFDNNPIDTRGRPLDSFTFTTTQIAEEEAYALASVLAEDWHHFPLRFSFWSDDGIGPEIGITASLISSTYANITAATWDTELVGPWTVMGFHANSGDPNEHFVVRSDGAKWINGVRNDGASTPWLTVDATTGALSITSENIKKMVAFHTHISAAMVASWYAFQASNAWTRHLLCSGSFRGDLVTTGKQFLGSQTGQTVLRSARSGNWVETDRSLSFRLDEVP